MVLFGFGFLRSGYLAFAAPVFSVALAQKYPLCCKDTNLEVRSSPGAERKAGLSAAEPDRRRTKAWPLALAHSNAIAYLHPISRKGEPGDGKERSGPTRRSLRRPNGRGMAETPVCSFRAFAHQQFHW